MTLSTKFMLLSRSVGFEICSAHKCIHESKVHRRVWHLKISRSVQCTDGLKFPALCRLELNLLNMRFVSVQFVRRGSKGLCICVFTALSTHGTNTFHLVCKLFVSHLVRKVHHIV